MLMQNKKRIHTVYMWKHDDLGRYSFKALKGHCLIVSKRIHLLKQSS